MERTRAIVAVSAIILLAVSFGSAMWLPVLAQVKELGSVHGTVVDDSGNALSELNVTAHDSYGKIIATDQTDEEGFFRFALYGGSYTISIEKDGYVEIESSFTVPENAGLYYDPENDPVNMGVITLKRTIRLSTSVLTRVVSPGYTLLLPITLANFGENPVDVELSTYDSAGWAMRIMDQSGEVRRVLLTSSSVSLSLEVEVPLTASGTYIVSFIASGAAVSTLNFTIIVQARYGIELTSTFPYKSSEIGEPISYPLSITNTGEMPETLSLLGVIPDDWAIQFIASDKTDVLQIHLLAGQSEQFTVQITPSVDAGIGAYNMTVKAVSIDGESMASLDLMANIRETTEKVEVATTFKEVTVEAGKVLLYPITIRNKGAEDSLVLLDVLSIPDNWKAVFESEDIEFSQVLVAADESMSLDLVVTPPSVVDTGSYKIVFITETADGTLVKQIELGANIVGSYVLGMDLSTLYTSATTGGSTSFTVTVSNTGQSPVTTLSLNVDAPSGWDVSVTPVQVASVVSKGSSTFNVLAKVPDSTVAGDYMITLKAQSDQVSSAESQLRVTVSAPTSWGLIGVGIAGIAIFGLVVVFRKFSRR